VIVSSSRSTSTKAESPAGVAGVVEAASADPATSPRAANPAAATINSPSAASHAFVRFNMGRSLPG
jgi:hypothetical protein